MSRTPRLFGRIGRLLRRRGLVGTVRRGAAVAGHRLAAALDPDHSEGIDIRYERDLTRDTDGEPRPASPDAPPRSINWVVPEFNEGSGGHRTLFRLVHHLERQGWTQRIVVVEPVRFEAAEARELMRRSFYPIDAELTIGEATLRPAEFTVASSWQTAYAVRRFQATRHKLYFIQDLEHYFHPRGTEYALAEATYRFGFTGIVAGEWIAECVRERYGMTAYPFHFSCDPEQHDARGGAEVRHPGARKRVLFYARSVNARRGAELGLLALERLHRARPEIEFVLVGRDSPLRDLPFPCTDAGVVPHDELARLYAGCDAALVLSFTNISLMPLEAMASGCPVVSNRGANVEWLLRDGYDAALSDPTPEALAGTLLRVLDDDAYRLTLIENGIRTAGETDWDSEWRKIQEHLERIRTPVDSTAEPA